MITICTHEKAKKEVKNGWKHENVGKLDTLHWKKKHTVGEILLHCLLLIRGYIGSEKQIIKDS